MSVVAGAALSHYRAYTMASGLAETSSFVCATLPRHSQDFLELLLTAESFRA